MFCFVKAEKGVGGCRSKLFYILDDNGYVVAVFTKGGYFLNGGSGRIYPDSDFFEIFLFFRVEFYVSNTIGCVD